MSASARRLPLPVTLLFLIRHRLWPDRQNASAQNRSPLFPPECVRALAAEERKIYFYPPPFHTLADELRHETELSAEQQAAHEVDPARLLLLGDFGLGSDAAFGLDYRSAGEPSVIRLQWQPPPGRNRWVLVAHSFTEFWNALEGCARGQRRQRGVALPDPPAD